MIVSVWTEIRAANQYGNLAQRNVYTAAPKKKSSVTLLRCSSTNPATSYTKYCTSLQLETLLSIGYFSHSLLVVSMSLKSAFGKIGNFTFQINFNLSLPSTLSLHVLLLKCRTHFTIYSISAICPVHPLLHEWLTSSV